MYTVLLGGVVLFCFGCTKPDSADEKKPVPEAVDLGLSVKWASWNVGAAAPQDYGYYFSWGETAPKDKYYNIENYKWGTGERGNVSKYSPAIDNKLILDLEDDAAYAAYGGAWRMPTEEEVLELCEATFLLRKVCKEKGVWGIRITSAKTRNSIFIPAAGSKYQSYLPQEEQAIGRYWSSSVSSISPFMATQLVIYPSFDRTTDTVYDQGNDRFVGASVRAVQLPD